MSGFIAFNHSYCAVLEEWGVFVDGVNPSREPTSVDGTRWPGAGSACLLFRAAERGLQRQTFIVAGAGELVEAPRQ
jgi:hypothetical protein